MWNILDSWDYQAKPREYDSCERLVSFEVKYVDASHASDFVFWPIQHMGSIAMKGTNAQLVN